MESKRFSKALITGSTSGLGQALAHFLQAKGIPLILTGRSSVDLSKRDERKKLINQIHEEVPDLIINNAGFGYYGKCTEIPIQDQLDMIEVNIAALVEITIESAKALQEAGKKGTILNISSSGAFLPFPTYAVYCSSKSFVNLFSKAVHTELVNDGIDVLCACPGQMETPFRLKAARGASQKSDGRTMPLDFVVKRLWKQIQRSEKLTIFDWRYRVMLLLSKLLPQPLLDSILIKSLSNRTKRVSKKSFGE